MAIALGCSERMTILDHGMKYLQAELRKGKSLSTDDDDVPLIVINGFDSVFSVEHSDLAAVLLEWAHVLVSHR